MPKDLSLRNDFGDQGDRFPNFKLEKEKQPVPYSLFIGPKESKVIENNGPGRVKVTIEDATEN